MPTPSAPVYLNNEPFTEEPKAKICTYKECTLAGIPRPLDNFHHKKRGLYGRSQWCKTCVSAYRKLHPDPAYIPDENTPTSKVCTRKTCPFNGEPQPLDNFYSAKSGKYGRSSWCKTCALLHLKRPPRQPRVLRPAPEGFKICCTKMCPHKGEAQPVDNFCKSHRQSDGHHHTCKDCVKEATLNRKQRNLVKFSDRSILFAEGKTKICSRSNCIHGGKEQPVTDYYQHIPSYDGLSPECKDCANEQNSRWCRENPEKVKQGRKKYKENNADKMKDYQHNYHLQVKRKFRIEHWPETKISQIRKRSERKGIPFNLEVIDLLPLPDYCSVFGVRLDYFGGSDRRLWASVDRVKPYLGYVKGNVRVISLAANMAKMDSELDVTVLRPELSVSL